MYAECLPPGSVFSIVASPHLTSENRTSGNDSWSIWLSLIVAFGFEKRAFSLTSTSAVGMILAACQDRLPDCASASAPKKATVESAAAGEETPPAEVHLIEPEKFGEPVNPGTKKPSGERRKGEDRTIKEGDTKERTGVLPRVWKTIEKTALDIYDRWNQ